MCVSVSPSGSIAGNQLFVGDAGNNRILIWNTLPTTNGGVADAVLGQADFAGVTANDLNQDATPDATPSAQTLRGIPRFWLSATAVGRQLFVSDASNHRVLVFDAQ